MHFIKTSLFFLFIFAMLTSCGPAIKILGGLKNPKVETKESLINYIHNTSLAGHKQYFLQPANDSATFMDNFMFLWSNEVLIYDSNGKRYCYQGTNTCSGVHLQQAFDSLGSYFQHCDSSQYNHTRSLERFLTALQDEQGNKVVYEDLPAADYYMVYNWRKFIQRKKALLEDYEWMSDLKDSSNLNFAVIHVNTDMLDEWGLEKGKKLKLKIRYSNKSVTMKMGKIPFSGEEFVNIQ